MQRFYALVERSLENNNEAAANTFAYSGEIDMEQIIVRPIEIIFSILSFAILARVLISWVRVDPHHPAVQFLMEITEPVLRPIREMMPSMGMFDFSPIIALLLLNVLEGLILYILRGLF